MISRDEIINLLTAAAAYDRRTVGEADVMAWAQAGQISNWSYDPAMRALHAHYAESTDFLMPGHITGRVRDERRQPVHVSTVREVEAPKADPRHVSDVLAQLREQFGWHDPQPSVILQTTCTHCGATPGFPCSRPDVKGRTACAPHEARTEAAKEVE